MKCQMDLSTKGEIFYNLAQKVAPTAINQMLTTTKYYSKAIVLAADLSLESHLKTSVTALILRGARQQPISTKNSRKTNFDVSYCSGKTEIQRLCYTQPFSHSK